MNKTADTAAVVIRAPQPAELQAIRQLRFEVLDVNTGEALKTTSDRDDNPTSVHMAAFVGDRPISTVRLEPTEVGSTVYRVRRMATAEGYRGQGIGSRVYDAAEAEALKRGATSILLHSRLKACPFYVKAGFSDTGVRPVYYGDETIEMIKPIA